MTSTGVRARVGLTAALMWALALAFIAASCGAPRGGFTKAGVVLPVGSAGTWDGDMVEGPSVVRDEQRDRWVMAYTGYGTRHGQQRAGIGVATSHDGVRWDRSPKPMLTGRGVTGTPDRGGATGPVLLHHAGRWILFYIGLTEPGYEGGTKTINYATSAHPQGPWKRRGMLVEPAGRGWRAEAVWHVSVVQDSGLWFMFFNATGADGRESIGYATAASPTGPWRVDNRNSPLLAPRPGKWDGKLIGDPDVHREGDRWVMDYYGFDGRQAADGQATTSTAAFPLGWKRSSDGPVLAPSEPFDAIAAHKPWVTTIGGQTFHYYTAVGANGRRQIALAIRR